MMNFFLELLTTFLAAHRTGAVTKAAKVLNTTQSNVSMRISTLEQQWRLELFDRSRRPWALTEAGQVFFSYAKEFTARANELEKTLEGISKGQIGACRIGGSLSVTNFLLPRLLGGILEAYPRIEISLDSRGLTAAIEEISRGEMHFAFILARGPISGLTCTKVTEEEFTFVGSPDSAGAVDQPVSVEKLRKLPLVITTERGHMSGVLSQEMGDPELSSFNIAARVSSIVGIKELIRDSQCFGLVPRFAVDRDIADGTLAEIKIQGIRLALTTLLVEHPSFVHSPTVELVKAQLFQQMAKDRKLVPA
jgi:DNA-binding transcriptional LysR family regulator